jgi:hypothetical protein
MPSKNRADLSEDPKDPGVITTDNIRDWVRIWSLEQVMRRNSTPGSRFRSNLKTQIEGWNVKDVKNMRKLFEGKTKFNADISRWNVSNVEDFTGMFEGCNDFSQDLSHWDVRNGNFTHEKMFKDVIVIPDEPDYEVGESLYTRTHGSAPMAIDLHPEYKPTATRAEIEAATAERAARAERTERAIRAAAEAAERERIDAAAAALPADLSRMTFKDKSEENDGPGPGSAGGRRRTRKIRKTNRRKKNRRTNKRKTNRRR